MAAWDKDYIIVQLVDPATGDGDTASHTVEFCPTDGAYPGDAVAATQLSNLYSYKPASDLDDSKDYWVYVDTTKKYRFRSLN